MSRLGAFEHLLLLALVRLGDDAYGVPIGNELAARTGRRVSPGAIYTALDRLERRGLVRSHLDDPTPVRGGKRRRCYRLTAAGATAVREAQRAMTQMAQGVRSKLQEE